MERKVIIIRGIAGAGKTHFVHEQREKLIDSGVWSAVCSADDFWISPATGCYAFDPKRIGEAHADCFRRFLDKIQRKVFNYLLVDNTCISPWEIAP